MKKLHTIILWSLTFICLYAILNIGLGILSPIGYSDNYININRVLINLSYSYIAGLIFYLFVSYLPNKIRTEKFKPIIARKINYLYNQINGCVVSFQSASDDDLISNIDLNSLKQIILSKSLYDISYYGIQTGLQMDNFLFLQGSRDKIFNLLDSLLHYKDYMKDETIVQIENIKDAKYFHLIKNYNTSLTMKQLYDSVKYREEIAKELYEVIKAVKIINK